MIMDRRVGRLLSVHVGLPQDLDWHGQMVRTAVWKPPVEGRLLVRQLNIDGAGQGDLADMAGGPVVHRRPAAPGAWSNWPSAVRRPVGAVLHHVGVAADLFPAVAGVVAIAVDVDRHSGSAGHVDGFGGAFLGTQPACEYGAVPGGPRPGDDTCRHVRREHRVDADNPAPGTRLEDRHAATAPGSTPVSITLTPGISDPEAA